MPSLSHTEIKLATFGWIILMKPLISWKILIISVKTMHPRVPRIRTINITSVPYIIIVCMVLFIIRMSQHQWLRSTDVHTEYIHTNIQTYKYTNIQTYKHTYIHTYVHTFLDCSLKLMVQLNWKLYIAWGRRRIVITCPKAQLNLNWDINKTVNSCSIAS